MFLFLAVAEILPGQRDDHSVRSALFLNAKFFRYEVLADIKREKNNEKRNITVQKPAEDPSEQNGPESYHRPTAKKNVETAKEKNDKKSGKKQGMSHPMIKIRLAQACPVVSRFPC